MSPAGGTAERRFSPALRIILPLLPPFWLLHVFVSTDALTKKYGDMVALRACTLGVERGEVFGLLGPNGAGKTTLLRLILGFLRPTSGGATVDGLDCYHNSLQVRQRLAYLPGDARLFRQMKGRDALHFFTDVRPSGSRQRAEELAERLELDLSRRVGFMSTGMRQKLALAATMAAETEIIILDEPTANLDPTVRATVLNLVREAQAEGRTVLFSSHVLSEVEEVCDRVVILRKGELVHTQIVSDLKQQHLITLHTEMPQLEIPERLKSTLQLGVAAQGVVRLETDCKLGPVLEWLATLECDEVCIEPRGLRPVYDAYHPPEQPKS